MILIPNRMQVRRLREGVDLANATKHERRVQASQDWYANIVGPVLVKHYPGVQWKITVQIGAEGAIVYIQIPKISLKFGMVIHMPNNIPELENEVRLAGGELLERFRVARAGTTEVDLLSLPTDIFGQVKNSDKGEL